MRKFAVLTGMVMVAACAGGGKQDAPEKVSLTFQTQLDSGNAAYRRGDYKASAKFFHAATEADKENLSGWYGVYMAESKLGNTEEANKAKAIVTEKAPEMPLTEHPKASAHPGGAMGGGMGGAPAGGMGGTMGAPQNPHAPTADNAKPKLPLDSIRAAKEKQQ